MSVNASRPHRNRVTPLGEVVATQLRGGWLGNRGILHRGSDVVRFHLSTLWIICALHHGDQRLPQWQPGHFTVLFFHDEAVALAAGHRPCALCRRSAFRSYRDLAGGPRTARELDQELHRERLVRGTHRRRLHEMAWRALPDGVFVLRDDGPALVVGDGVVRWTPDGYSHCRPRPRHGAVTVITPPSSVAAITAGYPVQIDDTATLLAVGPGPASTTASGPTSVSDE